jgi:hypothetical protein
MCPTTCSLQFKIVTQIEWLSSRRVCPRRAARRPAAIIVLNFVYAAASATGAAKCGTLKAPGGTDTRQTLK